jgi:hypothetical protein
VCSRQSDSLGSIYSPFLFFRAVTTARIVASFSSLNDTRALSFCISFFVEKGETTTASDNGHDIRSKKRKFTTQTDPFFVSVTWEQGLFFYQEEGNKIKGVDT